MLNSRTFPNENKERKELKNRSMKIPGSRCLNCINSKNNNSKYKGTESNTLITNNNKYLFNDGQKSHRDTNPIINILPNKPHLTQFLTEKNQANNSKIVENTDLIINSFEDLLGSPHASNCEFILKEKAESYNPPILNKLMETIDKYRRKCFLSSAFSVLKKDLNLTTKSFSCNYGIDARTSQEDCNINNNEETLLFMRCLKIQELIENKLKCEYRNEFSKWVRFIQFFHSKLIIGKYYQKRCIDILSE